MSGLRVALLAPCYWPEVRRGGERLVRDLADGLIARGHKPRLITSHPGPPSRALEDGLEVIRHWRPPAGRLRRRGFEDHLTHLPLSLATLRRGDDDVAHATYVGDAVVAARSGRPSVFSVLGAPDRRYLVERRRRVELWLEAAHGCGAVTVLSEAAATVLRRDLGIETQVVPPGVDTRAFTPGGKRHERPTILCASAVDDPMKRVEVLLAAFELVRRERRDARLVLDRPRDAALAARLAATDGVELLEAASRSPELVDAYREAWVCALPSVGEAFGLVLAESLACGTPVVGSDSGGIPEVLGGRPDVGRLAPPEDPQALAAALLEAFEMAHDPAVAAACRDRAEELSLDCFTDAYVALYREVMASG